MPELPKFRTSQEMTAGSRSTSMRQAMMTPQLRPMTKSHIAAQHSLTAGQIDVAAEGRAALAKYAVTDAVLGAVSGAVEIYNKIDDASQTMAMEKAAAEYSQRMATLSSQEIMTGGEIDPETGLQRHFGSEDRYNQEKTRLLNELTSTNQFSRKDLVHKFEMKVSAVDYANTDNLRSAGNTHRIEKATGDAIATFHSLQTPEAKRAHIDLMVQNDLITESKAVEMRLDVEKEQAFTSNWNIIKADNYGVDSAKVMSVVMTADFINKNGVTTANNLYNAAVDRYGLLAADSIVREGLASGSKETMNRLYLEYDKQTYQQMGLPSIEAKDAVMKVISAEVTAARGKMAATEKISAAEAKQGRINSKLNERRHYYQDYGNELTEPLTRKESTAYWKSEYGDEPPISVLNRPAEFEHQRRNFQAEAEIFPVVMDNWKKAMNDGMTDGTPTLALAAGTQIGILYNDPTMPVAVKQQMLKELGEHNMDIANGIANGTLSGKALKEALTFSRNIGNQKAIDESWNVEVQKYENQKKNTTKASNGFVTFMSEKLKEIDVDIPNEKIMGAPLNAFKDIVQRKYRAQLHGTNIDSYMGDAWAEFMSTWSPESRGVDEGYNLLFGVIDGDTERWELVNNSYYATLGSTNGRPTEQAKANITSTLESAGLTEVIARVDNNESYIVPRKIPNSENYVMYEGVMDEDGVERYKMIEDPRNRLPLLVSRSEKFLLEQAQREFENSAILGDEIAESIKSTAPDTTQAQENRRQLTDFLKREYSNVLKGKEIVGDVIEGGVDNFYGTMYDGLAQAFVMRGETLKGTDMKRFLETRDFGTLNLDEEANDMIWKYTVDYYQNEMHRTNTKRMTYTEKQMNENIAHIKSSMIQRGLVDPGMR